MEATITITFGEVCENHAGMQQVGRMAHFGFSFKDLEQAQAFFVARGHETTLIHLNEALPEGIDAEDAYILLVRNGVGAFCDATDLRMEHAKLSWDTKAKMRGRVVNKRARYNVCYAPEAQEPNYPEGKGRIVAFEDVPLLNSIRAALPKALGTKAEGLFAEGNLYYDVTKTYIGFHGDGERKKVVAFRLGATMPLYYQWYQRTKPIGPLFTFQLNHGDLYVMSEKATGYDWKKRIIPTLRHAAGAVKRKKPKEAPKTREEELMRMKIVELKEMLRKKKLKVSGKKAILVQRIVESEK
uniref:2OG-Fe(II) oxygenase superfamily protein n=1 Tax=Pithovirus LCPAC304 TaxID=2506594 RepID=A0A481Z8W3_9VIRU|nr:MAG: 2OG-Fe(II) oxygenase superfamily protein [Pithovirus LCPAC304]